MSRWTGVTIVAAAVGVESPPTQARSLEGRPLGMGSSLMLPEPSRLRLLELGSSFVTALGEQRQPMTWQRGNGSSLAGDGGPAKWKNDRL